MTCGTFLSDHEGSRERIVGSFLWVLLTQVSDRVTPNQAGSLIGVVPEMRAMMDNECAGEPSRQVSAVAAKVIKPFFTAALTDPEIK